jgi:hypothetical protein
MALAHEVGTPGGCNSHEMLGAHMGLSDFPEQTAFHYELVYISQIVIGEDLNVCIGLNSLEVDVIQNGQALIINAAIHAFENTMRNGVQQRNIRKSQADDGRRIDFE